MHKKTVLSIGAHPDDIEIGCGGTEVLLKQKGYSIVHVIATNGEEGSSNISKNDLRNKRKQEAMDSAAIIGVSDVVFLDLEDGLTSFSKEIKVKLVGIIRQYKPEIVFTHSKSDQFPDHRVVRRLTESAISVSSGPWYSEAENPPHKIKSIFGYEVWNPISQHQCSFDISSAMDIKLKALACHYSQTQDVDYLSAIQGLAQYRGAMTMKGKYAEVFEVIQA